MLFTSEDWQIIIDNYMAFTCDQQSCACREQFCAQRDGLRPPQGLRAWNADMAAQRRAAAGCSEASSARQQTIFEKLIFENLGAAAYL